MRVLVLLCALLAALLIATSSVHAEELAAIELDDPSMLDMNVGEMHTMEDMGIDEEELPSLADKSEDDDSTTALVETDAEDASSHVTVVATEAETVAEADRRRRGGKGRRRGGKRRNRRSRRNRRRHGKGKRRSSRKPKSRVLKHLKPWHRNPKNQPVKRTHKPIECLDGDCVRGVKVRKTKIGDHPNGKVKKPTKLDVALGAVKEEIMVRAKQLHKEKDWSKKVATLIDEYQQKLSKVTGNIIQLRAQTKALLRKKKQIQNVQIQNKLRYKLQLAQEDLNRLQKQMEYIGGKENEFSDTEKQLKGTMNALKNSLLKLRGQETQQLANEGI